MTPEKVYEEIKEIGLWFSLEDVQEFAKLKLPKKATILELGTGHGRSTKALRLLFPDADITTCDPGVQTPVGELNLLGVTFRGCRGDELEWDRPIDFLFVDDDHMKTTVKGDVDKFKPFVKKGGYIIFHDYYGTEVEDAIDDIGLKVKAVKTGEFSMAIWRNK